MHAFICNPITPKHASFVAPAAAPAGLCAQPPRLAAARRAAEAPRWTATKDGPTRAPNAAIKTMATGMGLLKPFFAAEAKLQAGLLGAGVDRAAVAAEIAEEIASKPIVIYTYALSPFSMEALAILEGSGYEFGKIELGQEWFMLGPKNSVKRVLMAEMVENGASSLPKVFVKGKCIGGCAELAEAVESGQLDAMMAK